MSDLEHIRQQLGIDSSAFSDDVLRAVLADLTLEDSRAAAAHPAAVPDEENEALDQEQVGHRRALRAARVPEQQPEVYGEDPPYVRSSCACTRRAALGEEAVRALSTFPC